MCNEIISRGFELEPWFQMGKLSECPATTIEKSKLGNVEESMKKYQQATWMPT